MIWGYHYFRKHPWGYLLYTDRIRRSIENWILLNKRFKNFPFDIPAHSSPHNSQTKTLDIWESLVMHCRPWHNTKVLVVGWIGEGLKNRENTITYHHPPPKKKNIYIDRFNIKQFWKIHWQVFASEISKGLRKGPGLQKKAASQPPIPQSGKVQPALNGWLRGLLAYDFFGGLRSPWAHALTKGI